MALDLVLSLALRPKIYVRPLVAAQMPGRLGAFAVAEFDSPPRAIAFAGPDRIAAVLADGAIELREISTGKRLWRLTDYEGEYFVADSLCSVDNNRRLIAWSERGGFWTIDAATGAITATRVTGGPARWSPGHRYFTALEENNQAVVVDAFTGETTPTTLIGTCHTEVTDAGESLAQDHGPLRCYLKDKTALWKRPGGFPLPLLASSDGDTLLTGQNGTENNLELLDLRPVRKRIADGGSLDGFQAPSRLLRFPWAVFWANWCGSEKLLVGPESENVGLLIDAMTGQRLGERHICSSTVYVGEAHTTICSESGQVTLRRYGAAPEPTSWVLDVPSGPSPILTLDGKRQAAVAIENSLWLYEIPSR